MSETANNKNCDCKCGCWLPVIPSLDWSSRCKACRAGYCIPAGTQGVSDVTPA